MAQPNNPRPVMLVVMDGIGIGRGDESDMVAQAFTPALDFLRSASAYTELKAHGTAVGLPSDEDMGNSEVGHNALGCGQIYAQGAKLVSDSIRSGLIFQSPTWHTAMQNCIAKQSVLHFIGLLSDGNVHSHIQHLFAMLKQAKAEGIGTVRIHILLDGRDVPPYSAPVYISMLESRLAQLNSSGLTAGSPPAAAGCGSPWTVMKRTGIWCVWAGRLMCWAWGGSFPPLWRQ